MSFFTEINTLKSDTDVTVIYYILDTYEGRACAGHWIFECAVHLPYIKEHMKQLSKPIKILLYDKKMFKLNMLSDFGFQDSDIEYTSNMKLNVSHVRLQHVLPMESEYIAYKPNFSHPCDTHITTEWIDSFKNLRTYLITPTNDIIKTIPILYLIRSRKECYYNNRTFLNLDYFCTMLKNNNVTFLDVDTISSYKHQFNIVCSSKVIIMEMGSAYLINACLAAENSHIIILNDGEKLVNNPVTCWPVLKQLCLERGNTIELIPHVSFYNINININDFETRIKTFQYHRTSCVICDHKEFDVVNSCPEFPIMAVSDNSVTDVFFDFNPIICKNCKCLQLNHLIDPSILYSSVYTNATFSSVWTDHHTHFGNFILQNTNDSSFLEIGANKGDLYKIISNGRSINYSVLDMYKDDNLPSELNFIQGNCETFNYTGFNTVILSHVFEHLYSPRNFLHNIKKYNVSTVYISIPNFEDLLKEESIVIINSQHTFYCDFNYITYLFSLYNYTCESSFFYNGSVKSYMIKFILNTNMNELPLPLLDTQLYKNIYINKFNYIKNIEIPTNCYIMPSGIYGQIIYYLLKQKENIIGFLDNNKQRHNNRLYGTDKLVYSPSSIDYSTCTIILCDCPYKAEIIEGLQKLCDTVKFLFI